MKIHNDHMYHGAALTQIAEHPQFTAINAFKVSSVTSRNAFKVNDDIGIFLKYATKPKLPFHKYIFTFKESNLEEIASLKANASLMFLALVCVEDKEICCLPHAKFQELIDVRKEAKGSSEAQYTVVTTVRRGKSFRVYVNMPGQKKTTLSEMIISRNDFPGAIFT